MLCQAEGKPARPASGHVKRRGTKDLPDAASGAKKSARGAAASAKEDTTLSRSIKKALLGWVDKGVKVGQV